MKKILLAATTAFCFLALQSSAQSTPSATYGVPFEQNAVYSPARLEILMKDQAEIKEFQIIGYISEVCQKEGCWFKINTTEDSDENLMVKTKDHKFLLPKDIAGRRALVYGTIAKKTMSVKEQQHYLEDAGASQSEIDAIKEPKTTYVMTAEGVQLF